jgi:hypothetical protein
MVLVCSPIYYGMYFAVYEPLKRFLSNALHSGILPVLPRPFSSGRESTRTPGESLKRERGGGGIEGDCRI